MEIKQATLKDIEAISYIHASSWRSAYRDIVPQSYLNELKDDFWVSAFHTWIKNDILTGQIIFDKETAVGCMAYGKSRDNKLSDWGEIVSIYLLPEYFGKGYGQKLLDVALADMKESGYQNIYLWVLKENSKAQKFYKKNKFQHTSDEYIFDIQGKQLIDIRFILSFD